MRLVFIGDTHGLHKSMLHPIPEGDVLIHAGDCTNVGSQRGVREFVEWYQGIKGFDAKIFIAGNHDWAFYRKPAWLNQLINDENLSQSDCVYLEDELFTIEDPEFSRPIKFWGTPWQTPFMNWAFNRPEIELIGYWKLIPMDTDILISHGPPEHILDMNINYENCGSWTLGDYVRKIEPRIHAFGHIHEGYGMYDYLNTTYINASTATAGYNMINKPIVVDLIETDGKLEVKTIK